MGRLKTLARELEIDRVCILTAVLLFFIGRFVLPGNILPFGIAAFAAAVLAPPCLLKPASSLLYGFAMSAGLLFTDRWWQFFLAFFSATVFYGIMRLFTGGNPDPVPDVESVPGVPPETGPRFPELPLSVKAGIALAASLLITSAVTLTVSGMRLSDLFAMLMQLAVSFASFYVFRNVTLIFADDLAGRVMTNEEMACLAITAAIAVMGLPAVLILGVSVRNIVCILIIMVFSYRGGLGTGAACGVTVGILLEAVSGAQGIGISGSVIAVYGFCGFLSGLLNHYRKIGVSLGFILGNLILATVLTADKGFIMSLYEVLFAVILFAALPDRVTDFLKLPQFRGVAVPTVKINYAEKIRRTATSRLTGFAGILREMSCVCTELTEKKGSAQDQDELTRIVERVSGKVCTGCYYKEICWEKHFYKNYQQIGKITAILEKDGYLSRRDIPLSLSKDCARAEEIVREVESGYEMYKIGRLWQRRMEDNKRIVPLQLKSMAEILEGLAKEVDLSVHFEKNLEKRIARALYENDLKAKNVTVSKNHYGRYDVSVDVKCCGSKKKCVTAYLPVISKAIGRSMVLNRSETAAAYDLVAPSGNVPCCNTEGRSWCPILFSEEEEFHLLTGAAGCPAAGCTYSGDSHSFLQLEHGQYMMALSDGMGAGEKAAPQSRSVIKLLELFMESGLRSDAAITMVNSLLETGCDRVVSATVDLCSVDLFSGKASFLKLGAVCSAIKRRGKVETVVVSSVPIGLVNEPYDAQACSVVDRFLEEDDEIILFTDGVLEAFKSKGHSEADFFNYIENLRTLNPQTLAEAILNLALAACDGKPKDDMTVLCSRVVKGRFSE